jgi:hypothetical protein
MNATQVARGRGPSSSDAARRGAVVVACGMAVTGLGLLLHAALAGARFELVVLALGFAAGAALIGLLVLTPGLSVTRQDD